MMYNDGGAEERPAPPDSSLRQQMAHFHMINLSPGEEPSPRLQPERRQTHRQDQDLRRDLEQLRMEMDALRARQLPHEIRHEQPPSYVEL
jgi:hypothetical protein